MSTLRYSNVGWDADRKAIQLNLSFTWNKSDGSEMYMVLETYHGEKPLWSESFGGVDQGDTYHITHTFYVNPFLRLQCRFRATYESENIRNDIYVSKYPFTIPDSYIKPNRPPVHSQWAKYVGASIMKSVNSCVANSITLGLDLCHLTLYGSTSRPSAGYLYGALYQDKGEEHGMFTNEVLGYVQQNGTALANTIKGDASPYNPDNTVTQYGNVYLKQPDYMNTTKLYDGAVQVHNKNKSDPLVIDSCRYAKISYWYDKWFGSSDEMGQVMTALMDDRKMAVMDYAVEEAFDRATLNGGVVGRLLPTAKTRVLHCSAIVGWKKIDGEFHWILQNSWGEKTYDNGSWVKCGDNGLFYLPFSWLGKSDPNVNGGIFSHYTFTYEENGQYALPKMPPPVLDVSQGKNGRGATGKLYVTWEAQSDATNGYTLSYTDESGTEKMYDNYYDYQKTTTLYTNKYGETFRLKIRKKSGGLVSEWSNENLATTLPKEATISLGQTTPNSVVIHTSVSEGKYTDIAVHRYENNVYKETKISTNGGSVTFTGLSDKVEYKFDAETRLTKNGTTLLSYYKSNSLTVTLKPNIQKFYWTTDVNSESEIANASGSDNQWYVYPITSDEWNTYIDTLRKVRTAKGVSTSRPLNDVSRGVEMMVYLNQGIDALNDMLTSKISRITSSTRLDGSIFLELQNRLNQIIDTL